MTTALVTAIGSFSADIVIKSLKKHGMRVIGCDIFPKEWIVDAYSVDVFFQVPRGTEYDSYLKAITDICTQEKVDYLLPLTDAEIDTLNENRDWFQQNGIQLCISSKETIAICRDKYQTYQALKDKNLFVQMIPTICAASEQDRALLSLPIVCKPINGRSSQGMRRLFTDNEYRSYMNAIEPEKYVLQPLIAGKIITVDIARNAKTGFTVCMPRKELLRTLNGAGTSVHVFHDDVLVEECRKIAACLNVHGCVNFEFIQTPEDVYCFLECNPRFSGGVEFSCMAGYDFVWAHMECFSGKDPTPLSAYQDCYIARKYEETVTAFG